MTIIIKRITLKDFVPPVLYHGHCPTEAEGSFRVYALVDNKVNTTITDIQNLELNDRKSALETYIKIFPRVGTGQPMRNMFDGKKYHKGHEFEYKNNLISIWRLWLVGDIRVYFIFPNDRNILILKTLAKRKDDLNEAEKSCLEEMVKKIIDCQKIKQVIEDES
jgi:hypothetical protein